MVCGLQMGIRQHHCVLQQDIAMSGNNNYRSKAPWGVWNTFNESPFREGEVTLGSVVQVAGYKTGFIGKWHLGGDFKSADGTVIFRGSGKAIRPIKLIQKRSMG